jgi:hypothetical protein
MTLTKMTYSILLLKGGLIVIKEVTSWGVKRTVYFKNINGATISSDS